MKTRAQHRGQGGHRRAAQFSRPHELVARHQQPGLLFQVGGVPALRRQNLPGARPNPHVGCRNSGASTSATRPFGTRFNAEIAVF